MCDYSDLLQITLLCCCVGGIGLLAAYDHLFCCEYWIVVIGTPYNGDGARWKELGIDIDSSEKL